jgi:hypothetical protein
VSEQDRVAGEVYRVGMNYCVDVPLEVGRALAARGERYVSVEGELAGSRFRTRLTPRGGGAFRLFLNGEVRGAAGVGLGDRVEVTLRRDKASGDAPLPDDLAAALDDLDGGRAAFESMTAAQRSGMIAFVERARSPETRGRYIARVVDNVRERLT